MIDTNGRSAPDPDSDGLLADSAAGTASFSPESDASPPGSGDKGKNGEGSSSKKDEEYDSDNDFRPGKQRQHPKSMESAPATLLMSLLGRTRSILNNRTRFKLEKILSYVSEKRTVTAAEIGKLLEVSDATASKHLETLVSQGRLVCKGYAGKYTYTLP